MSPIFDGCSISRHMSMLSRAPWRPFKACHLCKGLKSCTTRLRNLIGPTIPETKQAFRQRLRHPLLTFSLYNGPYRSFRLTCVVDADGIGQAQAPPHSSTHFDSSFVELFAHAVTARRSKESLSKKSKIVTCDAVSKDSDSIELVATLITFSYSDNSSYEVTFDDCKRSDNPFTHPFPLKISPKRRGRSPVYG